LTYKNSKIIFDFDCPPRLSSISRDPEQQENANEQFLSKFIKKNHTFYLVFDSTDSNGKRCVKIGDSTDLETRYQAYLTHYSQVTFIGYSLAEGVDLGPCVKQLCSEYKLPYKGDRPGKLLEKIVEIKSEGLPTAAKEWFKHSSFSADIIIDLMKKKVHRKGVTESNFVRLARALWDAKYVDDTIPLKVDQRHRIGAVSPIFLYFDWKDEKYCTVYFPKCPGRDSKVNDFTEVR